MSESTPTGSTTSARGSSSKAAARGGSRRHAGVDVVDEEHRIHEGTGFAAWLFVLPALAVALVFVIAPFACRSPTPPSPAPARSSDWSNTARCWPIRPYTPACSTRRST